MGVGQAVSVITFAMVRDLIDDPNERMQLLVRSPLPPHRACPRRHQPLWPTAPARCLYSARQFCRNGMLSQP